MSDRQHVKAAYPATKRVVDNNLKLLLKGRKLFPDLPLFFKPYDNTIGIEVEVEGVTEHFQDLVYWDQKEDGSLYDSGAEFVTHPISGHNIDYAIAELGLILQNLPRHRWSHRCSIHIHSHVGNLSVKKLNLLVALYAVLEPLFFHFVDEVRRGNPYCYHIRDLAPKDIQFGHERMKYCALNVGTALAMFNTVEFRHMHGTSDLKSIRRWVQLCVKLQKFVADTRDKEIEQLILNLNTVSNYMDLVNKVFGQSAKLFTGLDLKTELEEGALWAKVYLFA